MSNLKGILVQTFTVAHIVMCLAVSACSPSRVTASTSAAPTDEVTSTAQLPSEKRVGKGVACLVTGQNAYGIVTYSVDVATKPGLPYVSRQDLAVIRLIQRYMKTRTLRYAYTNDERLVVYDAPFGPCAREFYVVLNSKSCHSIVAATDGLDGVVGTPPGPCGTPRPWLKTMARQHMWDNE